MKRTLMAPCYNFVDEKNNSVYCKFKGIYVYYFLDRKEYNGIEAFDISSNHKPTAQHRILTAQILPHAAYWLQRN